MKRSTAFIATFTCYLLLPFATAASAEDRIVSLSVQEQLSVDEIPVVRVEVELDTTRDLHVAFQSWGDWKAVKRTMRRIKTSGNYHFEVPFDNLRPGRYRLAAYLTPRRKDWNDRLGESTFASMEVVEQAPDVEVSAFSTEDKVMQIKWPKEIAGSEEATLEILYEITQPRDVIVRLANSENWNQVGEMIFPVSEPGKISLPLSNLTSDFPVGNYAWIVWITESGTKETPIAKLGKHFVLKEQ